MQHACVPCIHIMHNHTHTHTHRMCMYVCIYIYIYMYIQLHTYVCVSMLMRIIISIGIQMNDNCVWRIRMKVTSYLQTTPLQVFVESNHARETWSTTKTCFRSKATCNHYYEANPVWYLRLPSLYQMSIIHFMFGVRSSDQVWRQTRELTLCVCLQAP